MERQGKFMDHAALAKEYFERKFLCSQAVFAAFAAENGLTEEQALKIGAGFGSGMCRGEVCGAVTGALMAIGLKYGQCAPEDRESRAKTNFYAGVLLDRFREENGSYLCRELLGCDLGKTEEAQKARALGLFTSFCPRMVESAARICQELLDGEPSWDGSAERIKLPD